MIRVEINGREYTNVSSITPEISYDYFYTVKTMDGKTHKRPKGKKTNYTIVFFNVNSSDYERLEKIAAAGGTVILKTPTGAEKYSTAEYFVSIRGNKVKGELSNGKNYLTGLTLLFEAVVYDA